MAWLEEVPEEIRQTAQKGSEGYWQQNGEHHGGLIKRGSMGREHMKADPLLQHLSQGSCRFVEGTGTIRHFSCDGTLMLYLVHCRGLQTKQYYEVQYYSGGRAPKQYLVLTERLR